MTDLLDSALNAATIVLPLNDGEVILDATTGAPVQFVDRQDPGRHYLLDAGVHWHSAEHAWGSGHVITDRGSGRWRTPRSLDVSADSVRAAFSATPHLDVTVERQGGAVFTERYRFENVSDAVLSIGSIGIQTPFADLYEDAESAIDQRVHAHVFTGGDWAWVLAQPMSGVGRSLGLIVRSGALWGYSIESRNQSTSSHVRGHLVMQVTDHARNADAFGGQAPVVLRPGEVYELGWEVSFFDDTEQFLASTHAPAELEHVAGVVGEPLRIRTDREITAPPEVSVARVDGGVQLSSTQTGTYSIGVGDAARVEIGFHLPLEQTVRARADYILDHQRSTAAAGTLSAAFLPIDTRHRLPQTANGWADWSDGSERIAMAMLLQMGTARGWLDERAEDAATAWAAFAREHLIESDGTPRRGSAVQTRPRLYDSVWLAAFFCRRYAATSDMADLDTAALVLERAFELGADRFLAIGLSEACVDVSDALAEAGHPQRAAAIRARVIDSARHFLSVGHRIPPHEVAYEQSIVAPLVNLLIDAHRLTDDPVFLDGIRTRLPWLLAFGGPQPHVRLRGVAIRHWDGYWFGLRRQWGDVFPHYWSALTASALYRLPAELRSPLTDDLADTILRANMSNYFADGSATCAFVFPTAVDGEAAHAADPLANDQDWHLVIWMDLATRYGAPAS